MSVYLHLCLSTKCVQYPERPGVSPGTEVVGGYNMP